MLDAESDSDWSIGHSTTGYLLFLCGCAIVYSSKRQPCIATSSTEAEIIAASTCSLALVFALRIARELGFYPESIARLDVDNTGAVELSRDRKSCHRSRHVDRRYFKVRELAAEGLLRVEHVPTADISADVLTKVLDHEAHAKHVRTMMNLDDKYSTVPKIKAMQWVLKKKNGIKPERKVRFVLNGEKS